MNTKSNMLETIKYINDKTYNEEVLNYLERFQNKLSNFDLFFKQNFLLEHGLLVINIYKIKGKTRIGHIEIYINDDDSIEIDTIWLKEYRGHNIAQYLLCIAVMILYGIYPEKTRITLDAQENNYQMFATETPQTYLQNKQNYRLLNFYSNLGFHPIFESSYGRLIPMQASIHDLLSNCNLII